SGKTEAPLAFLTVTDAVALRERLLAVATSAGAPVAAGSPVTGGAGAGGAVSGGGGYPAPAPAAAPAAGGQPFRPPPGVVVAPPAFAAGGWSLVVLASMIVAIIGVVSQPVRRILSDWNFRVSLQPAAGGPAGLRIRHGLTETRTQTVPLHRVQAVTVIWP